MSAPALTYRTALTPALTPAAGPNALLLRPSLLLAQACISQAYPLPLPLLLRPHGLGHQRRRWRLVSEPLVLDWET